jgi:hypothetical protein
VRLGAAAAAGSSIAGAGLGAYGDIVKSQGIAAGDTFQASMLEENTKRGEVAAVETGAQYSNKIANTLANVDVMRAASPEQAERAVSIHWHADQWRGYPLHALLEIAFNILCDNAQRRIAAGLARGRGNRAA